LNADFPATPDESKSIAIGIIIDNFILTVVSLSLSKEKNDILDKTIDNELWVVGEDS